MPLRIAIVGCGAVTRASLLPVLAGHDSFEIVALVDRDVARAAALGRAYGLTRVHADVSEIAAVDLDGAVIATPPAHHVEGTLAALERGWHVFVEKPMAVSAADARRMVESARRGDRRLSVGLFRRQLPAARLLRSMLEAGELGRPLSVDAEEGGPYGWQLASLSGLTRAGAGGGVLIDLGTHLLDQVLFSVPGAVTLHAYRDNARGGIETDCELEASIATRWGAIPLRAELSRTRELRNSVVVTCEHGEIELRRGDFCRIFLRRPGQQLADPVDGAVRQAEGSVVFADQPTLVGYQAFRDEFDDWLDAITSRREPRLSGESALPVVELIERCYATAAARPEPWLEGAVPAGVRPTGPGRVLVTGAGGFLGCRAVELLRDAGWTIRAMVRRPGSAARLARYDCDIVVGDVASPSDVGKALEGCDAVVHCAVGTDWPPEAAFKTTVEGTRVVAQQSRMSGALMVHVSSMAVHGDAPPATLVETTPFEPVGGVGYTRAKQRAEEEVWAEVKQGLRAIVLRPARIYGPLSKTFTVRPLSVLRHNGLVLQGDADSAAGMVFVDNVVEAIARALATPQATGQAYLIDDLDQVSWRDFYQFFANTVGATVRVEPLPSRPETAQKGFVGRWIGGARDIAFSPEVRALAKKVLATDPYGTWPRGVWDRSPHLQSRVLRAMGVDEAVVYRPAPRQKPAEVAFRVHPTRIVVDKAVRDLGFSSGVGRIDAMQRTRDWARDARLL